ncbi:MAG: glycosyltransferase family 2 protein [Dysgonamonadaceae bacterium]|jgi:GT2 family glycosyltransferase|nr:glycosyltransferase family 2 protein [Dysgonamonadaceae bacterium]
MKLSVIIVNYNVKYYLEQCLLSLKASIRNQDIEILVVDNHSSDGSLEYLRPGFPDIVFIANNENTGFSKANNQAIRFAKGEYLLLLNPDTVIGEHTLDTLCRFMDEHADAGALGVKMIDGHGCFLPESKRGFPSPWNSLCKMTGISKIFPRSPLFGKYHLKYLDENSIHQVDVLAGACMMLRKTALDQAGLLDESFFMYGEDIDLSYRISQAGYHNYYVPEKIIHYKGESTKKDWRYIKIFYEAMLIFFKKHFPHHNRFYGFPIYLAIYIAGAIASIKNTLFPPVKYKSIRNTPDNNIVFNTSKKSYEEIISTMDSLKNKKHCFWIYHPEIRTAIASNCILTGEEIAKYDFFRE